MRGAPERGATAAPQPSCAVNSTPMPSVPTRLAASAPPSLSVSGATGMLGQPSTPRTTCGVAPRAREPPSGVFLAPGLSAVLSRRSSVCTVATHTVSDHAGVYLPSLDRCDEQKLGPKDLDKVVVVVVVVVVEFRQAIRFTSLMCDDARHPGHSVYAANRDARG